MRIRRSKTPTKDKKLLSSSEPPRELPTIHYTVNHPWKWVMDRVREEYGRYIGYNDMEEKDNRIHLPSAALLPQEETGAAAAAQNNNSGNSTPSHRRTASLKKKKVRTSTISFDVVVTSDTAPATNNNNSEQPGVVSKVIKSCHHGISAALDGLDDKDELVRTLQRCRIDHLGYAPPSQLVRWDITLAECTKVITSLPTLSLLQQQKQSEGDDNDNKPIIAVLKEPLSTRGKGIHFVSSVEEIYKIMENHRKGNFLDDIIETKGRIPSWVLQAEISPPMLIRNNKKFHIRMYILVMETYEGDDLLVNLYLYKRSSVRIAAQSVNDDSNNDDNYEQNQLKRNPAAHITNGAFTTTTTNDNNDDEEEDRVVLITQVPELVPYIPTLEYFCATTFLQLLPDMTRRVHYTMTDEPRHIQKHALAGIDIMMTSEGKPYLLEVNVNPKAPAIMPFNDDDSSNSKKLSKEFQNHLVSFMSDMVQQLVTPISQVSDNSNNNNNVDSNTSQKKKKKHFFGGSNSNNNSDDENNNNNKNKGNNFVRLEDIVLMHEQQQQQQ